MCVFLTGSWRALGYVATEGYPTQGAPEVWDISPTWGYSGIKDTGMIERVQKSSPQKIPRASNETPTNPWTTYIQPPKKKCPYSITMMVVRQNYAAGIRARFYSNPIVSVSARAHAKLGLLKFQTPKNPLIIPDTKWRNDTRLGTAVQWTKE